MKKLKPSATAVQLEPESVKMLTNDEMTRFNDASRYNEMKKLCIEIEQGKSAAQDLKAEIARLLAEKHRGLEHTLRSDIRTHLDAHRAWVDTLKEKYKVSGQLAYDPNTGRIIE